MFVTGYASAIGEFDGDNIDGKWQSQVKPDF